MARPKKNSCDYFPHDNNMRNHTKVRAVRQKFANGYAIWSMLLEYLTGSDGNEFENTENEYELLSGDFGVSATEIQEVVKYCLKLEMLFEKNGFIFSDSLHERLEPVYTKRGSQRELSKKQLRRNGKYVAENTVGDGVSAPEIPQSKVQDTEPNKTEPNQSETPKPPPQTSSEFVAVINFELGKKFKETDKIKKAWAARKKEGFSLDDVQKAVSNAKSDNFHIENKYKYLTAEFFTRTDKLEKWINAVPSIPIQQIKREPTGRATMADAINHSREALEMFRRNRENPENLNPFSIGQGNDEPK